MEQHNYFLLDCMIDFDQAKTRYIKEIMSSSKYINQIDEDLLTIEEYYLDYYFFDAKIYNHPYYFKNKDTETEISGYLDISLMMSDNDFILNEIKKEDSKMIDNLEFKLYDVKKQNKRKQIFIDKIKEYARLLVSKRHIINPTKNVYIDISPLKGYDSYSSECFYEKIYVFRYRANNSKKDYISILSSYNQKFYLLNFVPSKEYIAYLSSHKRPIQYIPKEYLSYYYDEGFKVYLDVNKKLIYESNKSLLKKVKQNIEYENYSEFRDYLYSGIYYYKMSKYIKKIKIVDKPLKYKIFQSFLTLRYLKESGLFLYRCANLSLLSEKDNKSKIKFLEFSYKLGSLEAKKELYEYYSLPLNYDYNKLKKYS